MGRKDITLGDYCNKREVEGSMYNIQIFSHEDRFTKDKLSSLLFTLQFSLTLNYII